MANIISASDFKNEFWLPIDEIQAELTSYIVRFEPEILMKILGYDLKKAFVDGLGQGSPATKWTNLRDGKDYQVDSIYRNYRGIKNIITAYVWYQYSVYSPVYNSPSGPKALQTENTINTDYRSKEVLNYNNMIDNISNMHDYILWSNTQDSATYPNYVACGLKKINMFNI